MTQCQRDHFDDMKWKIFGTHEANASKIRREAESRESFLRASVSDESLRSKTGGEVSPIGKNRSHSPMEKWPKATNRQAVFRERI